MQNRAYMFFSTRLVLFQNTACSRCPRADFIVAVTMSQIGHVFGGFFSSNIDNRHNQTWQIRRPNNVFKYYIGFATEMKMKIINIRTFYWQLMSNTCTVSNTVTPLGAPVLRTTLVVKHCKITITLLVKNWLHKICVFWLNHLTKFVLDK